MRTTPFASVLGLALMLLTTTASADVAGMYDVKYEEVSTNCTAPLKYPHGKLAVKVKGTRVTVDIDRTPPMQGSVAKNGKVSAKSRSGSTSMEGMKGVFSVAGRITPEGMLTFVMVGEYTANGRALCSQSWNVTGSKADAPTSSKKTKKKRSAESYAPLALALPTFLR